MTADRQRRSEEEEPGPPPAPPYAIETIGQGPMPPPAARRTDIIIGMVVLGRDGRVIGRVKAVRAGDFLVDRMMARDVYVPYDAVALVDGQAVALAIASDDLDNMGWPEPPLMTA